MRPPAPRSLSTPTAGCAPCSAPAQPAAGIRATTSWPQSAASLPTQSNNPAEPCMNTTTKPNRILYATMGLLLAILLIGAGGFLWLSSGGGGNNGIGIGG